ncbi:MAG TPA: gliding motility-associated C-terminal domain-containing protein [Prolixibacteraceae bacterium]
MKLCIRFRIELLALLLFLFVAEYSVAQQGGIVVNEGQQKNLAVIPVAGETYAWRIYNKPTFQPADLATQAEVEYDTGTDKAVLPVLWKIQGEYFFTVTAFNSKGCKNMKAGYVKVIVPLVLAMAGKDTITGICNAFTLDATASIGVGLSYLWRLLDPGGILSADNTAKTNLTLSSGFTGTLPYSIRILLTVTNKSEDSDKDTVKITFGEAPKVVILYPAEANKDGSMLIDGTTSKGVGLKYHWSSTTGEIVGDPNKSSALIKGAGMYSLEVTDLFGCPSQKFFQYPFEPNVLIANADYIRTSWVDSVHIHVLNNDYDSKNALDKRSLKVIQNPAYGKTQVIPDGTIIYSPDTHKAAIDHFVYQICDEGGVCDTANVTVDIYDGPVWIPEAISPNGDGQNEYFVIRGLSNYKNSALTIYTRAGQLVYRSLDYQNDWSGKSLEAAIPDGTMLPTGTYYYVLHLGGTNRYLKGFVYLLY